jgi:hypothetical protein
MIDDIIKFVLTHIPLLSIIGLIVTFPLFGNKKQFWRSLLRYTLFWLVGVIYLWGGTFHLLSPEIAASSIGWKPSPFQREVAFYDIAVGIGALLAAVAIHPFTKLDMGIIFVFAIFSGLAGLNHVYGALVEGNLSENNAGLILWLDILTPILVTYLYYKAEHA